MGGRAKFCTASLCCADCCMGFFKNVNIFKRRNSLKKFFIVLILIICVVFFATRGKKYESVEDFYTKMREVSASNENIYYLLKIEK